MMVAVQFLFEQLAIYLTNLFDGIDLDIFIPNCHHQLPRDLVLVQDTQNDGVGIASKLIGGSIWMGKKMLQQLNSFVKTNSENHRVQLLFCRYYPVEDQFCNLQIIIDLLARVVYKIASKACEMMG